VQELLAAQGQQKPAPEATEETMPEEVASQVQQTLEAQSELIRQLFAEKWQSEAANEYPEVALFADKIVGPDRDSVMEAAKEIAERIRGGQKPADAAEEATEGGNETPPATPPTQTPVPAGSPPIEGLQGPTDAEKLAELRAIAKANPWNDTAMRNFLQFKFDMAAKQEREAGL
jgi:hypothetical protein